ncbi:flagellar motor switch protein FliM [Nitrospira sp.]|nr:flagellar motor switch protein FliM [Nitrospira sp.]
MAENVLSQDEVDALMRGMDSGDVETEVAAEEPPGGTKAYDLTSQERILRGRMPTFEMISDRFCRLQGVSWANFLRKPVEFAPVSTDIIKFGALLKKIPVPSSLSLFQLKPLRGHGLIIMDSSLVYNIVDHYFGGTNQTHVKPEGRDFTPVQVRVVKQIVERMIADLEKAWRAIIPAKVQYVRSESNPQFAMVVSVPEIVVSVVLNVDLGTGAQKIHIMYPYAMLEPIKDKLNAGFFADQLENDNGWGVRFREELLGCRVGVTVELGSANVPLRDILAFNVGDVVVLEQSPGELMTGFVEGIPKLLGSAGIVRGSHALRVARLAARAQR